MAKSEGNFFTFRDLAARGWTGREVRYTLLAVKYREPLNFTFESLEAARKSLARFDEWSRRLEGGSAGTAEMLPPELDPEKFGAALGALFDLFRDSNRLFDDGALSPGQARSLLAWRDRINSVLALAPDVENIPEDVAKLAARRAEARAGKDWAASDALRDRLLALGWQVKDTKDGQKLSPKG